MPAWASTLTTSCLRVPFRSPKIRHVRPIVIGSSSESCQP
jgi:hypothetical protein